MSQQQDIYLKSFSMQYLHLGKKRGFIFPFWESIVRAFFRRLMVFKESEESFSLPTLHCTTKLNIGIMYLYVLGCICTLLTMYYYCTLILQNPRSSFMMCTFYGCVNQTINRETIRRTFMVSKYTQINNIVTNIYVVHIVLGLFTLDDNLNHRIVSGLVYNVYTMKNIMCIFC